MPKLSRISSKKVIKALEKLGFNKIRLFQNIRFVS